GIRDKLVTGVQTCALPISKSVVSAFLRAYFDCDGCASAKEGVILSTFSDDIAQALQILLLNYGILSRRYGPNVRIKGISARVFRSEERRVGKECRCRWWSW